MSGCPACGAPNLAGADQCERCALPLEDVEAGAKDDVERHILTDPLSSLGPGSAPSVGLGATVGEALERLAGASRGCLLVVDGERTVGIFSERDVVTRYDPLAPGARERPVEELMTPDPETLDIEAPVAFALQRMCGGGYRHIPVTRDGEVVGLVSARDLLRYIATHGLAPAP